MRRHLKGSIFSQLFSSIQEFRIEFLKTFITLVLKQGISHYEEYFRVAKNALAISENINFRKEAFYKMILDLKFKDAFSSKVPFSIHITNHILIEL